MIWRIKRSLWVWLCVFTSFCNVCQGWGKQYEKISLESFSIKCNKNAWFLTDAVLFWSSTNVGVDEELMSAWRGAGICILNRSEWLWLRCPHGVIIAASRLLKQDAPTCDEVSWNPIFPATCVMWGQGQQDTQSQQMQHKCNHINAIKHKAYWII
jgi:hypothetical protein